MAQPALAPDPPPRPACQDHVVVLRGATRADYQRLLELRGERAVPRLTYLEGTLEIMSPSRRHEVSKEMIGCLVEAWCFERGVEVTPYGSWTLERKDAERGAEPDGCYVVGDDAEPALPHLAIEVVVTSGSIDKLEVYRKLGVGEVWSYHRGRFSLFALRGERYQPIEQSEVLAGIDLGQLAEYLGITPMTKAVRQYRAALRGE
jgi:Uma2 family endonuclease